MSALERLDEFIERYDADVEFRRGCRSAWSGQLRLTLTDPTPKPSRSIAFYSTGGLDPEDVAAALLADAERWLAESGTKPLPVPGWKGGDA